MKFCKECGSIMLPKKERNKNILKCTCGYKEDVEGSITVSEVQKQETEKKFEIVDSDKVNLPTCDEKCDKCGNEKAYYWIKQTRAADEPPTKFLRCTKCKYTWRDYD